MTDRNQLKRAVGSKNEIPSPVGQELSPSQPGKRLQNNKHISGLPMGSDKMLKEKNHSQVMHSARLPNDSGQDGSMLSLNLCPQESDENLR